MPGRNVGCNSEAHTRNVPWALVMTVVLMEVTLRATIHGALVTAQNVSGGVNSKSSQDQQKRKIAVHFIQGPGHLSPE